MLWKKKDIFKNFAKFTWKYPCQSLFFNRVAGLRPETLFKKRLWNIYFTVNFATFLRTPFLKNTVRGYFCLASKSLSYAFALLLKRKVFNPSYSTIQNAHIKPKYQINCRDYLHGKICFYFIVSIYTRSHIFKSTRRDMFCKKDFLTNFTKFTEKHLCQSPLFNKVSVLSLQLH